MNTFFSVIGLAAISAATSASDGTLAPQHLRCEYLENPLGIDITEPRLSWKLHTTDESARGLRQSAYQVQVASSAELLTKEKPDLWNSGKVASDETVGIVYAGQELASGECCYWRVRVWDHGGMPSEWSVAAFWTIGLLDPVDWTGQWITAPPVEPKTTVHFGYRSKQAPRVDTVKWVQIDLGKTQTIDAVRLWPTWPLEPGVAAGGGFPVRFRVEVSNQADFAEPRMVVDRTNADVPNPGMKPVKLDFAAVQARFVRLTATQLSGPSKHVWDEENGNWRAEPYGRWAWLALGEMEVIGGGRNLALGKAVTALDEWDDSPLAVATGPRKPRVKGGWAREHLTDGRTEVDLGSRFHHQPVTLLRREFRLNKPIRRAVLYATARGMYEIHLNGRKAGDHRLAPGWTMYDKRILYQTHEVTDLLQPGLNAIGALLGDGWYRMRKQIDWFGGLERFPCFFHADDRWLLAQLEIEYEDGSRETIATDRAWECHTDGPIRRALIFDGFQYDAGKEIPGWDAPRLATGRDWKAVIEQPLAESPALSAQMMDPIRVRRELEPVARTEPAPGVFVFDFGEQLSGVYRIRVHAPAGTEIKVRHAEGLRRDGQLYVANLMGLHDNEDQLLLGRSGLHTFTPRFTLYGFRYLEVTGVESARAIRSIEALELTSDVSRATSFTSSDPRLNQLCSIVDRAYRVNMPSLTVDTTARDERMPWLGDCYTDEAQSLSYLYDYAAFGANQARAIDDALNSEGIGPVNLGHVCPEDADAIAGWCDASVAAPYVQWLNFADRRALRRGYEGAKRFMDAVAAANPDGVPRKRYRSQFGDWLSSRMTIPPGATAWEPPGGKGAPQPLFAAAFWAHSADLTARMAESLGETEDAQRFRDLVEKIRAALAKDHVRPDGTITGNEQSSYALLLGMDHLDGPLRQRAHTKLLDAIVAYDSHLATGSITTIFLLEHLVRSGRQDLAYQLVMQPSCPSYGHMVDSGATAMWERFDGWHPKLGFNPAPMNAFSHLGMNSIYQWIIGHIAGIRPDPAAPGYRHFYIVPKPPAGLDWIKARYDSIRGPIAVEWRKTADRLNLALSIPPNISATVILPDNSRRVVESGHYEFTMPNKGKL